MLVLQFARTTYVNIKIINCKYMIYVILFQVDGIVTTIQVSIQTKRTSYRNSTTS